MSITVVDLPSFSKEELIQVLNYYNTNKSQNEQPLEELDRSEGGFMIKKEDYENLKGNINDKIKQLRWSKGQLVPFENYCSFSKTEEKLLYESFINVFGKTKLKDFNPHSG